MSPNNVCGGCEHRRYAHLERGKGFCSVPGCMCFKFVDEEVQIL